MVLSVSIRVHPWPKPILDLLNELATQDTRLLKNGVWRFFDPNVPGTNQPFRRKMSLTPFFSASSLAGCGKWGLAIFQVLTSLEPTNPSAGK
jgi:hypothetical protein